MNSSLMDPKFLAAEFKSRFGDWPQIYRAPGRVNLIGDHTDYNDGFVLPAAIGFYCWVSISKRADGDFVVFSENLRDTAVVRAGQGSDDAVAKWGRYPQGIIHELRNSGYEISGANLHISSDVPIGAGLSSSAAMEVASAYALLGRFGHRIEPTRVALLCQKAENDFVGARCGIMDQFASCHGTAHHALFLDCRSLEYRKIRLPDQFRMVICNTMVQRQLSSHESQYNARREECEEGVRQLGKILPNVRALRDVTLGQVEKHRELLSSTIYKRCRHVITENDRVSQMAAALESNNRQMMKELMHASHLSLRDDYEVSCPELDLMVGLARQQEGVYGSRMTGAGFGGCTVNLVLADVVDEFQDRVSAAYLAKTGRKPEIYACEASDGAAAVQLQS
ncbi:MAG TPA: galactokinase [Candidatus Acidoferrales bacterium]|nr:galactokinase [Candidatus Acidoferrales bacterium]